MTIDEERDGEVSSDEKKGVVNWEMHFQPFQGDEMRGGG